MRRLLVLLLTVSVLVPGVAALRVQASSAAEIQWIKPEELKRHIEAHDPDILVVDVQPRAAYDLGHIKGAVNFPWALEIRSPGNLPRNKILILYCDCGSGSEEEATDVFGQSAGTSAVCAATDDSVDVAEQLMTRFGYQNIRVLEGGWSRWQGLGYPIEKN